MHWRLLVRYSLRGIGRGGQRVVVAMLSVLFGVMSLVAMVTLSQSISTVLIVDPRLDLGGDAQLAKDGAFLAQEDIAQIARMHTAGLIERYALVETPGLLVLKTPDSGRVTFLRGGVGFDPDSYPLLGEIVLGEPSSATPQDVLQRTGDVIVTRDVALDRRLHVGDEILVTNRLGGRPRSVRVAGIATSTPNYQGGHLYYSTDTSRMATGRAQPYTGVYVLWGSNPDAAMAELAATDWQIRLPHAPSQQNQEIRDTFDFMLGGAGILGLLVGGIGIANTMQVLLTHRREEVAILKTLGYSRQHMVALFTVETALIGLIGSTLGVALAVVLSRALVHMVERIVTLFLPWRFSPWVGIGGLFVGVTTTVLFAMNAILQASDVRPAALFRHMLPSRRRWVRTAVLYGLLAIPFGAITSLILGSVLKGIGVLLLALGGLIGFGLLLGGSTWMALRLLPTFRFHLLRMARNNMRRRGFSLLFAMMALLVGVFALGLAITIISSSVDELARRSFSLEGINLVVLADPVEEDAVRQALADRGVQDINTRFEARVQRVTADGIEAEALDIHTLQGRNELWDVEIEGAPWGTVPHGAYLATGSALPIGTQIVVTGSSGKQSELTVVGTFEATEWEDGLLTPAEGVLVEISVFTELCGDQSFFIAAGKARVDDLSRIRDEVGIVLPQTTVLTSIDVDNLFSATLKNLFVFAVAMSGLALAAGSVLIANAVSLAMIDRQYEIGILKAVGYTRGKVMLIVLLEYSLIALVASVVGVFAVELFVVAVQVVQEAAGELLHVDTLIGLSIVAVSTGLTLLTVLISAWRPTKVRPLAILNRNT
jgi:putative ABC transport system permease protein